MVKCEICGQEFTTYKGLGGHIVQKHEISTQKYYDTYSKQDGDGFCKTCGKPTHFKSVNIGYAQYCLKCSHNTEECKQKRETTNLIRYGSKQVLSVSKIRDKAKFIMKEKYGNEEIFATEHFQQKHIENSRKKYGTDYPIQNKEVYKRNKNRYYQYEDLIFDSSWELAVYIWYKDNNLDIQREPCQFDYIGIDGKKHKYFPDFLINGQIIEIKGTQYLDENGKLKDTAKQKCVEDNNVVIWSYNEVKPYIQYCKELFNDKYWYKTFKYNTNYKPSHCKHTKLIETPIKCLICNQIFQNGNYLSAHLKFIEHINSKDYYDTYLKKENEEFCVVCGKPTKYLNFTKGYQICCSRKCASIEKGVKISNTKQSFTEEHKQEIKEKRENTCLEKYGVTSNLATIENIEKSHSKEVRQKAKETHKKHIEDGTIIGQNVKKSWKTRNQQIKTFCETNNCTLITDLISQYGQGFLSLELPRIYINKQNNAISNDYLPLIEEYFKTNQYSNKSKAEQYIIDNLNYTGTIIHNDRTVIKPKEIDIYMPDLKIGIEYNGIYWHSVENGTDKYSHRNKSLACRDKGIRLIHIYEFEDIDEQIYKLNQLIVGKDLFDNDFNKNSLLPISKSEPNIIYKDKNHTIYGA